MKSLSILSGIIILSLSSSVFAQSSECNPNYLQEYVGPTTYTDVGQFLTEFPDLCDVGFPASINAGSLGWTYECGNATNVVECIMYYDDVPVQSGPLNFQVDPNGLLASWDGSSMTSIEGNHTFTQRNTGVTGPALLSDGNGNDYFSCNGATPLYVPVSFDPDNGFAISWEMKATSNTVSRLVGLTNNDSPKVFTYYLGNTYIEGSHRNSSNGNTSLTFNDNYTSNTRQYYQIISDGTNIGTFVNGTLSNSYTITDTFDPTHFEICGVGSNNSSDPEIDNISLHTNLITATNSPYVAGTLTAECGTQHENSVVYTYQDRENNVDPLSLLDSQNLCNNGLPTLTEYVLGVGYGRVCEVDPVDNLFCFADDTLSPTVIGEQCINSAGCYCKQNNNQSDNYIIDTFDTCNPIGTDGIKTVLTSVTDTCLDGDGCTFNGEEIDYLLTPSYTDEFTLSLGETCNIYNNGLGPPCDCGGVILEYGQVCEIQQNGLLSSILPGNFLETFLGKYSIIPTEIDLNITAPTPTGTTEIPFDTNEELYIKECNDNICTVNLNGHITEIKNGPFRKLLNAFIPILLAIVYAFIVTIIYGIFVLLPFVLLFKLITGLGNSLLPGLNNEDNSILSSLTYGAYLGLLFATTLTLQSFYMPFFLDFFVSVKAQISGIFIFFMNNILFFDAGTFGLAIIAINAFLITAILAYLTHLIAKAFT